MKLWWLILLLVMVFGFVGFASLAVTTDSSSAPAVMEQGSAWQVETDIQPEDLVKFLLTIDGECEVKIDPQREGTYDVSYRCPD